LSAAPAACRIPSSDVGGRAVTRGGTRWTGRGWTRGAGREISHAYERIRVTRRELVAATDALSDHERRAKVENADTLLEAKNERTASLYLEGILDTPEHAELLSAKRRAELEHYEARMEVERLELLVRLLEASSRD
jgi:hypothetical protein